MYTYRRIVPRTDAPQPVYAAAVDAVVQTWAPAFAGELASYRTKVAPALDVRQYDWAPQNGWITTAIPAGATVAQTWPASASELASFRTPDRPRLDVRQYEWSPEAFRLSLDQSAVWQPAFDAERSTVTPAAPRLDVRRYEWGTAFGIAQVVDATVATWQPAFAGDHGGRTAARASVDVRAGSWAPEQGWVFAAQPPAVSVAQMWPAIWLNTNTQYQTVKRPGLDVRRYEWATEFGITRVVDPIVRTWMPAMVSELASFRTPARPPLDVRLSPWQPDMGWLTHAVPPVTFKPIWAEGSNILLTSGQP